MNRVIDSRLTAPGRMDAVQKVLRRDPFFNQRMASSSSQRKNRRGIRKSYNSFTIEIVMSLAQAGLDAARMRRDEILARAFQYCEARDRRAA